MTVEAAMHQVGKLPDGSPVFWAEPGRFDRPGFMVWKDDHHVHYAIDAIAAAPIGAKPNGQGAPVQVPFNPIAEVGTILSKPVRGMMLNPSTASLVLQFAHALAIKLAEAEEKHGYSDNWLRDDWERECKLELLRHITKGDPLDVAAYAAFHWAHGWSTTMPLDPWLPIDAAALTGDLVWCLVDYSAEDADHPLADATYAATIGHYQEVDGDEGQWELAGWCWTHDHFTAGRGKVLAYKPIGFALEAPACFVPKDSGNPPADAIDAALASKAGL